MPKKQPDLWQPMLLDVGKPKPKPEEKKSEPVVEYDAPLLRSRQKVPPPAAKKGADEAPWWHRVRKIENDPDHASHPVLAGIATGDHAYFVHSYHLRTAVAAQRLAVVDYGEPIAAIVARDNMIGTQFHPEKSQATGLRLIGNFLRWKP